MVWAADPYWKKRATGAEVLAISFNSLTSFNSRRVDLESLTEKLDTGSPTGKLVFHVFAALAEFEHNLILETISFWKHGMKEYQSTEAQRRNRP
jgi:DNA invertase Pin-like site-specific DNA recombinase